MDLRWIVLFPVFGALLNGVVVRSSRAWISGLIATVAALLSFGTVLGVLGQLGATSVVTDSWFTWIQAGDVRVDFLLEATPLTAIMLMVVTGIGSLIHLYSIGYMSHDEAPWRFFSYLNLFLAAMLVLLLSGDLVGVFMGWEGVGLCSYLLIGFWYQEKKNAQAGMKAFLTNRVGDLGFVLALMLLMTFVGTTQIRELIAFHGNARAMEGLPAGFWALVGLALFWAATGKSAQIPLYVWLPDAMAGPTPVSALIHAATMVTSGIFLIVRIWPLFAGEALVLNVILWIGLATAAMAALIAVTQRDIKKVLAYSTVSQLGFMFAALGAGSPVAALFHVVTHACFKALLFLGAGSVIHGMHENQDLYAMGGLRKKMPLTHAFFLVATLAIIGFPLTAGFFSKDMILAHMFGRGAGFFLLLLAAALLTAFYMFRLYALAFCGTPRSDQAEHAHESTWIMWAPLGCLAILSLSVGWFETPDVIGGIHRFAHWVESSWYGVTFAVHGEEGEAHISHLMEWILILTTSGLSLASAYFAWMRYGGRGKVAAEDLRDPQEGWRKASWDKFYVDELYVTLFVTPLKNVSAYVVQWVDTWFLNGSAHLLEGSARWSSRLMALFHGGSLQVYAWYMVVGSAVAVLLSWVVMRS